MALVKCRECEKEISDKAEDCPACGAPTLIKERKKGGAFASRFLRVLKSWRSPNEKFHQDFLVEFCFASR